MSDAWRDTVSRLLFVVGILSICLFGGADAIPAAIGAVFICWLALGIRTGWWIGTREDVDALVQSFMKKMRFFRAVRDETSFPEG